MITEFEAQLMSVTIDKQKLSQLASDVCLLVAELTSPRDLKHEDAQRSARQAKVTAFCESWQVTKLWVNDLVDRYEELVDSGMGHAIRVWLKETSGDMPCNLPLPRAESVPKQGLKQA